MRLERVLVRNELVVRSDEEITVCIVKSPLFIHTCLYVRAHKTCWTCELQSSELLTHDTYTRRRHGIRPRRVPRLYTQRPARHPTYNIENRLEKAQRVTQKHNSAVIETSSQTARLFTAELWRETLDENILREERRARECPTARLWGISFNRTRLENSSPVVLTEVVV